MEVPLPDTNPEVSPDSPKVPAPSHSPDKPKSPKYPDHPGVNPDRDPDIPERPGPPLSDPEAPRG